MRRERWIQLGALLCMVLFLGIGGMIAISIAASSGRNRLVYADAAEGSDPPQVALGIAMGAFRGLFVNYLWIRANDLKEAGKYFEAVDLAKTITRLQPRFPKVWQFHAWNLAYNISVATQTQQERWNWVQSGIRLLRDEGIPANPNDISLHRELAWIYLHKVQGYMDDAHHYYKRQVAREFTILLGAPPNLTFEQRATPQASRRAFIDRWIRPIADAPDTLEEVYTTPNTRELIEEFKRLGLGLDLRLLERVALVESVLDATQATGVAAAGLKDEPIAALMADKRFSAAGKVVIRYARKRMLVDTYHMEPQRMVRYMEKYGPFDWRHPASHAFYWSRRGSEEGRLRSTKANESDFDFTNVDRLTVQAVQELFRSGLLTYDIVNDGFYLGLVNTDFIGVYKQVMTELREGKFFEDPNRSPYTIFGAGYENFMRDAIRYLYRRGDIDAALSYQRELYTFPGLNTNNPWLWEQLSRPLDEFVVSEIRKEGDDRSTNPTVATQEISAALYSAFVGGLLQDDAKQFRANFDYARLFHATFQDTQAYKTFLANNNGRLGLPPFDYFASFVFAGLIEQAGIPQGPIMFRRAPADLQGRTYAFLERTKMKQQMDAMSKEGGVGIPGFNIWFPEPENMAYYRSLMFAGEDEKDRGRVEQK